WLYKEWANILRIRANGVPVLGFTWYSLTDQVDWDTALRENNGNVNPLGLYDLDRNIRPVGKAYKRIVANWSRLIVAHSICLTIPRFGPHKQAAPPTRAHQGGARATYYSVFSLDGQAPIVRLQ